MPSEALSQFERDLRYALRQLWSARGLTLLAVLTLALGIGTNTALFTVIDDVLVRPLPYARSAQLVSINPRAATPEFGQTSWLDLRDLRQDASGAFQQIAGYDVDLAVIEGPDGLKNVVAPRITPNLFPLLGVKPLLGSNFTPEDGLANGPEVVLLSESLWRGAFHADPRVVGRVVKIGGVPRTVVGVVASRFPDQLGSSAADELWLPMQPTPVMLQGHGYSFFDILARLRPGVSMAEAQAQVDAATARIRQSGEAGVRNLAFTVSGYQQLLDKDVRPALLGLMAALALVLLIACANVANMLIARFLGRRQEFAIRIALGAGRDRLVAQLVTEGALLSVAGAACGILLAEGALMLLHRLPPDTLPLEGPLALHWPVVLVLVVIAAVTTILSSLLPALLAARTNPQQALQAASRGLGSGAATSRLSNWLVVAEVALSSLLLVATGLLFHTLWNLEHAALGFTTTNVTSFSAVSSSGTGFSGGFMPLGGAVAPPATAAQAFAAALEQLRAAPGVESAALVSMPPFSGFHFGANGIDLVGRRSDKQHPIGGLLSAVSADYTRTLDIPMLRGRAIGPGDTAAAPKVAVVNQAFATKYFPDEDPLQHQLIIGGKDTGTPEPYTIVGVIPDQPDANVAAAPRPLILLPYQQIPTTSLFYSMLLNSITNFVVKTRGNIPVAAEMRAAFHRAAPSYALDNFTPMRKTVSDSMASQRLSLELTSVFAGLAIVMLVSGLYGVLAQVVSYRRREIAVRMALGSSREGIARMVVRQGTVLVAAGLAIGIAAAVLLGRTLQGFLYHVQVLDAWTLAGVVVLALAIGVAASLVPALRAARVEPMEALREG